MASNEKAATPPKEKLHSVLRVQIISPPKSNWTIKSALLRIPDTLKNELGDIQY